MTKRKASPKTNTINLHVPPIMVGIRIPVTAYQGGQDASMYGDTVTHAIVRGGRLDIANKLNELASFVSGTKGDDVESGEIVVLFRNRRGGQ